MPPTDNTGTALNLWQPRKPFFGELNGAIMEVSWVGFVAASIGSELVAIAWHAVRKSMYMCGGYMPNRQAPMVHRGI